MKNVLMMAVLILLSGQAFAVPNCDNLTGTWKFNYKIGSSPYSDKLIIKSVSAAGYVSAINQFNSPLHGYCKNGTVTLTRDESDYLLDIYLFANESPGFARWNGIFSFIYDFTGGWEKASVKKISSSTRSVTQAAKSISANDEDYQKMIALQQLRNYKD